MRIVIDIPGIMYDWFDNGFPDEEDAKMLWDLVKNGTPLPKGHGDLIDRKVLMENAYTKGFCSWYDEIKMADTIIEADKAESEDKLDGDLIDIDKAIEHYKGTLEMLKDIDWEDKE